MNENNIETWVKIPSFDDNYMVSNFGRVASVDREIIFKDGRVRKFKGTILVPSQNPNGYLQIGLSDHHKTHTKCIHKLVANAFVTKPTDDKNYIVNHKDGCKTNNTSDNLEWVTYSNNAIHSYNVLNQKRPQSSGISIPVDVYSIIDNTTIRYTSIKKASNATGISKSQIIRILNSGKYTKTGYSFSISRVETIERVS